jgi:hypothetical protein
MAVLFLGCDLSREDNLARHSRCLALSTPPSVERTPVWRGQFGYIPESVHSSKVFLALVSTFHKVTATIPTKAGMRLRCSSKFHYIKKKKKKKKKI